MREGEAIIATQTCKMILDGKDTLTIGKTYTILKMHKTSFRIKDDSGHDHIFDLRKDDDAYWKKHFKRAKQNGR